MTTSNPFDLLGLPLRFDLQKSELDARLRELSKVLHPDRHAGGAASDRRLALNRAIVANEAVRTLRDPVARGHALLSVLRPSAHLDEARVDQSFLFELMEMREELATATKAHDWLKVATMGERSRAAWSASVELLTKQFGDLAGSNGSEAESRVAAIQAELAKLKYWQRLMDEVGRIEAEQD